MTGNGIIGEVYGVAEGNNNFVSMQSGGVVYGVAEGNNNFVSMQSGGVSKEVIGGGRRWNVKWINSKTSREVH
jgi:hypothetical protein